MTRNSLALALTAVAVLALMVYCHPQDDEPPANDHEVGRSTIDFDTGAVIQRPAVDQVIVAQPLIEHFDDFEVEWTLPMGTRI